jgi:ring-1,2-phenylacetyl-CoA epoxidase subunit PaaC
MALPDFNFSDPLVRYVVHLADNTLVLGQRLGEWCGHGPVLEQDIAMTNISLDLIGQSRLYFQYAASLMGEGVSEDDLAFLRDEREYLNCLLVEQPNGDWGKTIIRQFLFDSWHFYFLDELLKSSDSRLSAISEKSIKEVAYHLRYSSEWVVRLGDGTEESHRRMQAALDELWRFGHELLLPAIYELEMIKKGIGVDLSLIADKVNKKREETMQLATLIIPTEVYPQQGGKEGNHTEHMGFLLAELQYIQRAHPGLTW